MDQLIIKIKNVFDIILTGRLKKNCDDILFQEFCLLLKNFDLNIIEKIVLECNLFDLLDDQINLILNNQSDETFSCQDINIVFSLYKSIFNYEQIFQLYLKTNCTAIQLLLDIFNKDKFESIRKNSSIKLTLYSFINTICRYDSGWKWMAENLNLNFKEILISYNTDLIYVQDEILLLLANIMINSDKLKLNKFNLMEDFAKIEKENQAKALLKIFDHLPHDAEFLKDSNYLKFIHLYINEFDLINWTKLIILMEKYMPVNVNADVHILSNLILKHALEKNDDNQYLSILFSLTSLLNQGDTFEKWFAFIQIFIKKLKNENIDYSNLSDPEISFIKTFISKKPKTFESKCLFQLSNIDSHLLDQQAKRIKNLLKEFSEMEINFNDETNLKFLLKFFEKAICHFNDAETIDPAFFFYTRLFEMEPQTFIKNHRMVIVNSVKNIYQKNDSIQMKNILDKIINYLKITNPVTDCQYEEILEITVEIIYLLFLKFKMNDTDLGQMKNFIEFEKFILKKNYFIEASCLATIISTLFMAKYYMKDIEDIDDEIFEKIFNLNNSLFNLEFIQNFFFNVKDILIKYKDFDHHLNGNEPNDKLLLLAFDVFKKNIDTEFELILWDVIDLIFSKKKSLPKEIQTKFYSLILLNWKNSLISIKSKMAAIKCFFKYQNFFTNKNNYYQQLMLIKFDMKNFIKENGEMNKIDHYITLLNDIIFASELIDGGIIMDCD